MQYITKEFHIKCKVKPTKVGFKDEQSKGISNQEDTMVFLIPCEGGMRDAFLSEWLPETDQYEYVDIEGRQSKEWSFSEIGFRVGHPVFGVFRGALRRFHPECKQPHILVMTKGVEEILKKRSGETIEIVSMSELKDEELDNQTNYDLSINKNR